MSKHQRILFVINGTDIGGTETALAQIAGKLHQQGHHVDVMSLKRPGSLAPGLVAKGIDVETLDMDEDVDFLQFVSAVSRMRKWLSSREVEVVHSFLPRANVISRLANRLCAKPALHISSERSTDFNRSSAVVRLNRLTTRWSDLILAVSSQVRDVLTQREHIPQSRITIVGNGLDLDLLDQIQPYPLRHELSLGTGEILFCAVGRLVPDKGHRFLVAALDLIKTQCPTVHLVIAGDGPERSNLVQQVASLDLEDRVHILGMRRDVPAMLKAVDVFVLPSLEEGISVALLEAMACSLPVIATRVGGTPDLVKDNESGLLIPPAEMWTSDPNSVPDYEHEEGAKIAQRRGEQSLAEAMMRLAGDTEMRHRFGKRARKIVEENYNLDSVVYRLESIYQNALDSK